MQPSKSQLAPFCQLNQDSNHKSTSAGGGSLLFILLKILETFPLLAKLINGPDSLLRDGTFGVSVRAL